jgi:hypothetical protein
MTLCVVQECLCNKSSFARSVDISSFVVKCQYRLNREIKDVSNFDSLEAHK